MKMPLFFSPLKNVFADFAILNKDLQLLHLECSDPRNSFSLVHAAKVGSQFFQLKEKDLFVTNDPSCGGLGPGELTYVTTRSNLFFVFSSSFPSRWNLSSQKNLDGMMIPPSPLRTDGQLNLPLVQAISTKAQDYLYDPQFEQRILKHLELIDTQLDQLEKILSHFSLPIANQLQKYFSSQQEILSKKILENYHGETRVDLELETGEQIKLALKLEPGEFVFNFSGTSHGKTFFMPEPWVQSVCLDFVFDMIQHPKIFTQGTLTAFKMVFPMQSCLGWKSAQSIGLSKVYMTSILSILLWKAFSKLNAKKTPSLKDFFPSGLQWSEGQKLFQIDRFSSLGTLAQSESFEFVSLNEKQVPVKGALPDSVWTLQLKCLKETHLTWASLLDIKDFPRLEQSSPVITVNDQKIKKSFGEIDLKQKDLVSFRF